MENSDGVFGDTYSKNYDTIYGKKDYEAECELAINLMKMYMPEKPVTVLDLGCGTGNHALILSRKGFEVSGVDISDEMLEIADEKAKSSDLKIDFFNGDIRNFNIDRKFDSAIMMFAVLGYQNSNGDLINCLKSIRNHLKKGSILVFDCWCGPPKNQERRLS